MDAQTTQFLDTVHAAEGTRRQQGKKPAQALAGRPAATWLDLEAMAGRCRKLLDGRGRDADWLATAAGVHRMLVANLLGGQKTPLLWTLVRVAAALGTTLDYLVLGRE